MRTPNGRECSFYYADYHRRVTGKELCRLIEGSSGARHWTSALCADCPVPDIQAANQCANMILHARIGKRPWHFWERPRLLVQATCKRNGKPVPNPYVGCGQCHAALTFIVNETPDEK